MLGIGIEIIHKAIKQRSDVKMIYEHIEGLVQQALAQNLIEKQDEVYARNQVLAQLNLQAYPETKPNATNDTIPNLLDKIINYAIENDVIEDVFDEKEVLTANIMNCFIARPSIINQTFQEKYKESPKKATDYFYHLSQQSNYIQMNRIAKNIHFKADTKYGELDITINMSKPEKDPEQIRREKEMKQDINYPLCVLCIENEGYEGRTGYAARSNHRIIKIPLRGENWYFQYSPYVYYNEHSILLSEEHRDMIIDRDAFANLLAFVEKFPHYFIGSNADLPIVGGSILNHDHYQAGRYTFPMTNADVLFSFTLKRFPELSAMVLDWPLTTIRLQSEIQKELIEAADYILNVWKTYNDEEAHIRAYTGETRHNTITPIARKRDELYELDLVLRNNRTTEEHPLGIFHPHADVHHIKKENIGLIEVMGLAVLPARLKEELEEIKKYLQGEDTPIKEYHEEWAHELKEKYGVVKDASKIKDILEKEVGYKFARVLQDAGVMKDKETCQRFIQTLNE